MSRKRICALLGALALVTVNMSGARAAHVARIDVKPAQVAPGERVALKLTFSPSAPGTVSARMVIGHDGETIEAIVHLTGVAK